MSIGNPVKQSSLVVAPVRDSPPDALKKFQNSYQASLDRMVQLYLQPSVMATLPGSPWVLGN